MTDAADSFPIIFANGGLPAIPVQTSHASAMLYLHGAHLTDFQPAGQKPVLFLSGQSYFSNDKPIRGGVPIIFPWFGPHPANASLPMHGFARMRPWQLDSAVFNLDRSATLTLRLSSDAATRELFPHDWSLTYTVHVASALTLSLTVENTSNGPFRFEQALHTYLNVSDVRQVSLTGLRKASYIDKADQMKRKDSKGPVLHIGGETDRIYLNTSSAVTVEDPAWRRTIRVEKTNSLATVIWNPHVNKAKAMADFGDDEWKQMLCVESANVADHDITLLPRASHTMTARLLCTTVQ